jgi:hypothetical protein
MLEEKFLKNDKPVTKQSYRQKTFLFGKIVFRFFILKLKNIKVIKNTRFLHGLNA